MALQDSLHSAIDWIGVEYTSTTPLNVYLGTIGVTGIASIAVDNYGPVPVFARMITGSPAGVTNNTNWVRFRPNEEGGVGSVTATAGTTVYVQLYRRSEPRFISDNSSYSPTELIGSLRITRNV